MSGVAVRGLDIALMSVVYRVPFLILVYAMGVRGRSTLLEPSNRGKKSLDVTITPECERHSPQDQGLAYEGITQSIK